MSLKIGLNEVGHNTVLMSVVNGQALVPKNHIIRKLFVVL